KPLAPEIDLDTLAAGTPGFTGADLANLVNEAALLAARRGKKTIEQEELEEGIMRVIAGPEKKTRLFSEEERKITAYHELGHAIVGHYLDQESDVHKISIIGRGQALGYTISLPREDRYLTTKQTLMNQLAMTLGGRAAEEIVFNEVTTGAANDLEKVTHTAKQMIMRFGMSEKLGPRVLGRNHDMPFLGREMGNEPDYSEEIAREIDDEIRRVIEEAHMTATEVLKEHSDDLHKLSLILIERETIDKDQFERLLAGEDEESVFAEKAPAAKPEPELEIGGMTCASCAARVEKKLNKLDGVVLANVNYATELASVAYDSSHLRLPDLVHTVEAAGYTAALSSDTDAKADLVRPLRTRLVVSVALTFPLLLLAMVPPLQFGGWEWAALALATPIVLWAGLPFHRAAVSNARHFSATMAPLVSLGTLAAWGWSAVVLVAGLNADVYFEVAGVTTTLILLGRFLEARARRRSGAAIRALLELGAKEARVLRDGAEVLVPADQLQIGDAFVVRPGEKIA